MKKVHKTEKIHAKFLKTKTGSMWQFFKEWILKNYLHFIAAVFIILWTIPYFTTSNLLELGDFSFFSQAYEAIRVSIVDYGQFPWWNPWMNGGIPLYANPQMGVFSLQTLLTLLFGAPIGLKISLVLYTFVGYLSMNILLEKYFKVTKIYSIPLSLSWIFCSFFVAHLPTHYTFLWFMIIPLFAYLALTIKSWKGGLLLGSLLAIVALSAIHYSLFYACMIVFAILGVRFFLDKQSSKKSYILTGVALLSSFILIAGHRLYLTVTNVASFNREVTFDPAISFFQGVRAIILPFGRTQLTENAALYPTNLPFGWGETTSSIGVILTILLTVCLIYFALNFKKISKHVRITVIVLFALGTLFFIIGLGNLGVVSPYALLKELPMFSSLRVSTRWFVFVSLCMLILIGVIVSTFNSRRMKLITAGVIILGCIELFAANLWYQNQIFVHTPNVSNRNIKDFNFDQTELFSKTVSFPNGKIITNSSEKQYYREYEATTYNLGVIRANEALVNNMYSSEVRCAYEQGCGLILSKNAVITFWSPNKLVIQRTAPGDIQLNVNNSSYYHINGNKNQTKNTVETTKDFVIKDSSQNIEVDIKP